MTLSESIFAVLSYHSIFKYPLTAEEIHKFQTKESTFKKTLTEIANLQKQNRIGSSNGLYYLKNQKNLSTLRKARQKISKSKMKRAKIFAQFLKAVPTIKLVGISGALAMENCQKNDDIDFFIITQKGYLWTTRFLANLLMIPVKRDPRNKNQKDKACLNLFLDESDMEVKDHNLYSAHEISQLQVLWAKNNTHQQFLNYNSWVKNFLPNWEPEVAKTKWGRPKKNSFKKPKNRSFIEKFLKNAQLKYMESKITNEKIGDTQLFFHPNDIQSQILKKYSRLTKNSG